MRWITRLNVLSIVRHYSDVTENPTKLAATAEDLKEKLASIGVPIKKIHTTHKPMYIEQIKKNLTEWIEEQEKYPKPEPPTTVFPKLSSNPSRKNIPPVPKFIASLKFREMTDEDIMSVTSYFKQLTRYSYIKKEKIVYSSIKSIYDKYKSLDSIRDEFLYFNVKKNNGENIEKLLKRQSLNEREQTYLSLLDMPSIFKDSKSSLPHLRGLTSRLAKNKIPISNDLIYKLYYTLPREARYHLINLIKDHTDIHAIVFDSEALKISSYDELKGKLLTGKLPFTYASYIQLSKAMVKENRVIEGLNFIQHLVLTNKCEIPLMLAKYTSDLVIAHDMHLCLPIALSLQRITGCSLKPYIMYRIESSLISSKILNDDIMVLLRLFFSSSNWKVSQLKDEVIKNIEKSDLTDDFKERFINKILISETELLDDDEYREIRSLFRIHYSSNDIPFKPGNDTLAYEPIFRLFPSYHVFKILRDEIHAANGRTELLKLWNDKIEQFHKSNPPLFSKLCEEYINVFIENNDTEKILPFVKFVRSQYKVNIEYTSYMKLFTNTVVSLDAENLNQAKMHLAVILANLLSLNIHKTTKAFNVSYPLVEKVYAEVEHTPTNELLNEWLQMQYAIKFDDKIPPV